MFPCLRARLLLIGVVLGALPAAAEPASLVAAAGESRSFGAFLGAGNPEWVFIDPNGNKSLTTDAEGKKTRFEYDAANRLSAREDGFESADAAITTFVYDKAGNLLEEKDARAAALAQPWSVKRTYDELNRLETETDGEANVTTYGYDPEGNRTSVQTPKGPTTTTTYDELGKPIDVTQPPPKSGEQPLVTRFRYDENRNLVRMEDADTRVTKLEYDDLNRLFRTTRDPEGLALISETTDFDEDGRPLRIAEANGEVTRQTWDELGRLKARTFEAPAAGWTAPWQYTTEERYSYDPNSNLERVEERDVRSGGGTPPVRVTTRGYDRLDRQTSETVTLQDASTKSVTTEYWRNGQVKSVTDQQGATSYTYDGQNREQTVTTSAGETRKTYYEDGLVKDITFPNLTKRAHGYDRADRLLSIVTTKDAATVASTAYTYDPNGNRLTQVQTNGGVEETTTYTYDDVDRMASVTYAADAQHPNGWLVTYGLDGAGNRETEVVTDPQTEAVLESRTGVFDNANRLTELTDNLDAAQTTTLAWDRNGNLLSETKAGVTTTYRYDLRDTLAEVERGGLTLARFLGDFDERRVLKIGDPARPGGSGVQEYVYNGSRLVLDVENGQPVSRYEWTNEELVSLLQGGGQRRYFALDGLETVMALTDETGQATDRLNFDAWGAPKAGTDFGTSGSRFAFTSHRFDTELNLYYAGGRMYSPTIGRFISQDTLSLDPNNPDSWNLFAYARGNPTFYTDPTGHYSWSEFKSDAKWGKDFIVAFGSDLAQNAPDRAVRIAGATVQQAGELAVQTAAMAHDTAVLTADAAARVTTGEGFDNITLYSQMAQSSAQRLGRGESVGDIIKDSAFEMGANALTVGTYGTFKQQFSTAADYLSGNATIEQVESRLINAAGGAVLNAGLGAVGAKVAGEGWMGKPVSVPSPATVVESFSQLPGRARATAQSAWDATSRVLNSEVKLTFDPTVMSMNGLGGVGVKLVPPKAAAAASKGVPETVAGVSRHAGPEAFRRSHPEYGSGSGYEVHHSVEWNALQRYRGTFTPEQLNLESMMRPLRSGQTMQGRSIHRSVVRKSWDNFRDVFQERFEQGLISPERMQKLLLTHRDFIDRMYLGGTPGL